MGAKEEEKPTKVSTAEDLRVPAGNTRGAFEPCALIEVENPKDAENIVHVRLAARGLA